MSGSGSIAVVHLFRFMRMFGITMFSILEIRDEYVRALVAWEDGCEGGIPDLEESQEVVWRRCATAVSEDALVVAEYAYDTGFIDGDRIQIDPDTVGRALGWSRDRVTRAVTDLLEVRVDMLDDGEMTDGFQLHL